VALSPGARLGPYEVIAQIGEGGMGEVYRAKSTRLPREVATKVSAQQFSERFADGAQIIASLNHPNISTFTTSVTTTSSWRSWQGPTGAAALNR
jgi:serine/threonine protein kinase